MEKSLHNSFIKKPCRIQVIFCLCLAMLFTFLSPSFNTSASYPYTSWGAFDGSGDPVQMFDNDIDISLTHMIELSFIQTISDSNDLTNLGVSYSDFVSSLNYFGLSNLLANWQPGNPEYYLNIGYYKYNTRCLFALFFTKSNGKGSYSPSISGNNDISLNNDYCFYFSPYIDQFIPTYGHLSTSNGFGSQYPFSKSIFIRFQFGNDSSTINGNFFCDGVSKPYIYNLSADSSTVLDRFSSFLNSYDYDLFVVLVPDRSHDTFSLPKYALNCSIIPWVGSNYKKYPLFSTIFSYDYFADDLSVNYLESSPIYFLPYLNRFSSGIVIQDTSDVFSYGYLYGGTSGIVTPTPIPTYAWTTPTPFPSVTFIPATLTPIVVPYDPYIIGSDDTWDNLAGYLGILNTALKSPVNKFFSDIMQVTYSFSDWFKFVLVVPIICLFAFIIGRLKRK